MTVSNSVLLKVEQGYRSQVQGTLMLTRKIPLVLATRKTASKLLQRANAFIQGNCHGAWFAGLLEKYVEKHDRLAEARSDSVGQPGTISPFDGIVRVYGQKHGIDWRLIAAQMYQESRFDPRAKSWVGALGLMQVMPTTGAEMGFSDLFEPDSNVQARVKYLARLMESFDRKIPMKQRVRFALAAYNAGIGHVQDARLLARSMGLDPNHWFGGVEKAMVLLDNPRYYRAARHGFCRGQEPVTYVSRIQSKYDAFVTLVPAAAGLDDKKAPAKEEKKSEKPAEKPSGK